MQKLTAFTDGGCRVTNPGLGACAFVLKNNGEVLHTKGTFLGEQISNNVAEYQGLITLLEYLRTNKLHSVLIFTDSALMANQVNGVYRSATPHLLKLRNYAQFLLTEAASQLKWVPREQNTEADAEVNRVLDLIQQKVPSQQAA
jgi:ribonuclease HI